MTEPEDPYCENCDGVRCMHFVLRDWHEGSGIDECDGWCCPACRPEKTPRSSQEIREIREAALGYVIYDGNGERVASYSTLESAVGVCREVLPPQGGGLIIRPDGSREEVPTAAGLGELDSYPVAGTLREQVKYLSGFSDEEIDRLGGVEEPVTNPTCPLCGLPGGEAMIPAPIKPGDTLPQVRKGLRYECGTTEDVQSRLCASIVECVEAAERRIVEWLRTRGRTSLDAAKLITVANAHADLADAIERGEHR